MKMKKDMVKKTLAFLLCMVMICSVFSVGIAAYGEGEYTEGEYTEIPGENNIGDSAGESPVDTAEHYGLWIGGTELTSEYFSGSGWSYDNAGNVLTLSGAAISAGETDAFIAGILYTGSRDLQIAVSGDCQINAQGNYDKSCYGIISSETGAKITIFGQGKLSITTGATAGRDTVSCGLAAKGDVSIAASGADLEVAILAGSGKEASYGTKIDGKLTVSGVLNAASSDVYGAPEADGYVPRNESIAVSAESVIMEGDKAALSAASGAGMSNSQAMTVNPQYAGGFEPSIMVNSSPAENCAGVAGTVTIIKKAPGQEPAGQDEPVSGTSTEETLNANQTGSNEGATDNYTDPYAAFQMPNAFVMPNTTTEQDTAPAKADQQAPQGLFGGRYEWNLYIFSTNTTMEYRLSESGGEYQTCGEPATMVSEGTYDVRFKGSDLLNPSPDVQVTASKENPGAPTGVTGGTYEGSLYLFSTNGHMEYSTDPAGVFTPCGDPATSLTSGGTYYVRYAASDATVVSDCAAVTVNKAAAGAPQGLFGGIYEGNLYIFSTNEQMEIVSESGEVLRNCDNPATMVEAGTYLVRYKETASYAASEPVTVVVEKAAYDAPSGLTTGVYEGNLYIFSTNGKMEYREKDSETYQPCGDPATQVKAGTYLVRYSATGANDASADVEVTVEKAETSAPTEVFGGPYEGNLYLFHTNGAMEYRPVNSDGEYSPCSEPATPIEAGEYLVRYKETELKKASSDVTVSVEALPGQKTEETPTEEVIVTEPETEEKKEEQNTQGSQEPENGESGKENSQPQQYTYALKDETASTTWSPALDSGFTAEFDAPFAEFKAVSCNGSVLTNGTDYEVREGSTILELKKAFLEKLAPGTYSFVLEFKDKNIPFELTVEPVVVQTVTVSANGSIALGTPITATVEFAPANATDKSYTVVVTEGSDVITIGDTSSPTFAISGNKEGHAKVLVKSTANETAYDEFEIDVIKTPVHVKSIHLISGNTQIEVGGETTVQIEFDPADATDKRFSSSKQGSTAVEFVPGETPDTFKIKGVSVGVASILVTSLDNTSAVDSLAIEVKAAPVPAAGIKAIPEKTSVPAGEKVKVNVEITPAETTNKAYRVYSSNPYVASVPTGEISSASFEITGVGTGTATITVESISNPALSTQFEVTSDIKVKEIVTSKSTVYLKAGAYEDVSAVVNPTNATDKRIGASSGNSNVARLDTSITDGRLRIVGKAAGETDITLTTQDGSQQSKKIHVVVSNPVQSITMLNSSGKPTTAETITSKYGSTRLIAYINPSMTTTNVSWTSSNPSVAYVIPADGTATNSAVVTGYSDGTAVITASADGKTASCTVTVSNVGANYSITYKDNSGMWYYDYPSTYTVKANAPVTNLYAVAMDGNIINASNYSRSADSSTGGTTVTISQPYMRTLTAGKHLISLYYNNGSVSASTYVYVQSIKDPPKTGDAGSAGEILAMALSMVGIAGTSAVLSCRKKKND